MSLASKVALITGGASGLGLATALRFAKQGAKVAVIDLQPSAKLQEIPGALFFKADITKEDEVRGCCRVFAPRLIVRFNSKCMLSCRLVPQWTA